MRGTELPAQVIRPLFCFLSFVFSFLYSSLLGFEPAAAGIGSHLSYPLGRVAGSTRPTCARVALCILGGKHVNACSAADAHEQSAYGPSFVNSRPMNSEKAGWLRSRR